MNKNTRTSHVKSELARSERGEVAVQCPATTKHNMPGWPGYGTTVQCTRPASRHRVHEALGYYQWEK